uniref:hypothetical protein n=1 Tax=Clostridium sp. 12(A) TaxID=1163671 RepID=UPI0004632517|nr:hypothetical protein [Clostridium sp. 12(A)]
MDKKKDNPLGIISIFASLAEVAGTVVIKFLPENIQSIFIWYVISFPIMIVILFFFILYKKPQNFYTPEYYKDENNFVTAMIINKQKEMLDIIRENVDNDATVSEEVKQILKKKIEKVEVDLDEIETKEGADNKLSIEIEGNRIEANSVKMFYRKIFEYLIMQEIEFEQKIPFKTGSKRYLINKENKHINGGPFFAPIIVDDYYIESHKSKNGAITDIKKFLKAIGVSFN